MLENVGWIRVEVLMLLCFQMDSHTFCPCFSAFLPFSVLEYVSRISKFTWKCYYKVCWSRRLETERSALMGFWCLTLHSLFKEKKCKSVWLKTCSLLQQIRLIIQESLSWVYFLSLVSDQLMVNWTAKYEAVWFCQIIWRGLEEGLLPW